MKISKLSIENFRGIKNVVFSELPDTIVIAGANGSGKSTIFDAIRLWKSAYASYGADEIQFWLQEFGLGGKTKIFARLLQALDRPMVIEASIQLTKNEIDWMKSHAGALIREAAYRRLVPNYAQFNPTGMPPMPGMHLYRPTELSESLVIHEPEVLKQISDELPVLINELSKYEITGRLICYPDGRAETINNLALARLFGLYDSRNVGVIDYYSAQRTFAREEVGAINLQIEQYANNRQHNALYNTAGKLGGVKQELASAYIRDLIATAADNNKKVSGLDMSKTLNELFETFFPGKKFLGVQPSSDGSISFDVETEVGRHDINELSSGEKELLYGYLRLRNYSPNNSIILIDEPELHLNPRLTDGLVGFYHRHIGKALGNQLWLVTHSDMILRQAVGQEGCKVYHMLTATSKNVGNNQALEIKAENEISQAVIDIVGDLAAYKPGAKIVFIEGGGKRPFDEALLTDLFPEFVENNNVISSGSKSKVRIVGDLLDKAREQNPAVGKIFSITDGDNEDLSLRLPENCFRWDRYHIENYLLEPDYIAKVLIDIGKGQEFDLRTQSLLELLRERALETLDDLIRHEIEQKCQGIISRTISTNTSRDLSFSVSALSAALHNSHDKFENILNTELSKENLVNYEIEIKKRFNSDIVSGNWVNTFKGRDVLKAFVKRDLSGYVRYEVFRDLILAKMRIDGYKPDGIKFVLDKIDIA